MRKGSSSIRMAKGRGSERTISGPTITTPLIEHNGSRVCHAVQHRQKLIARHGGLEVLMLMLSTKDRSRRKGGRFVPTREGGGANTRATAVVVIGISVGVVVCALILRCGCAYAYTLACVCRRYRWLMVPSPRRDSR